MKITKKINNSHLKKDLYKFKQEKVDQIIMINKLLKVELVSYPIILKIN